MEEDVTAPGLLVQTRTDCDLERSDPDSAPASDSDSESEEFENDEVLGSGGEELEEVDESALGS